LLITTTSPAGIGQGGGRILNRKRELKATIMRLNVCQPLWIFMVAVPHWFDIGALVTKVAVIGLFILTLSLAVIVPSATFLTRVSKWILVLMSSSLLIAHAIFTFGSPLAGVIYWSSCSLAGTVLLPLVAILLVIGLFRGESRRFVLPQIAVCSLLGVLCFTTT
jgi:hypothetical protein